MAPRAITVSRESGSPSVAELFSTTFGRVSTTDPNPRGRATNQANLFYWQCFVEIQVLVVLLQLLEIRGKFTAIEVIPLQGVEECIAWIPENGARDSGEYITDTCPGASSMRSPEEDHPERCGADGAIFLA